MPAKKKPRTTKANQSARKAPRAKKAKGGAWDGVFAPRAPGEKRYWLVKSEPDVFSFDDLLRAHNRTTQWNGVRNFVARNFLRDGMQVGDRVFYYHSMSTNPPAIVGICEVVRAAYPDETAFESGSDGYDPKSDRAKPTWFMVDLRAVAQFTHPVTLEQIKTRKELKNMAILRIGRLSVTPVAPDEWATITRLAET
jgi:predicted RNA-binding protein with PUA-like domain